MKLFRIFFLIFAGWVQSYGQDGSDIRYFKTFAVDNSLIGKSVHFDFFNRSFRSQSIDTIAITIGNESIKFIEVRKDDGYNNWFSRQSLQSIDKVDGLTIKIPLFKLDSITSTSFHVTMHIEYFDSLNNYLAGKEQQVRYIFNKKDIIEVLVKSSQR